MGSSEALHAVVHAAVLDAIVAAADSEVCLPPLS
jgi:hypothetical protein